MRSPSPRLFLFLLLLLGALASPAAAKPYVQAAAGVQYEVPAGWKPDVSGDTVTLSPKEGTPVLTFVGVAKAEVDATLQSLEATLGKLGLSEMSFSEPQEAKNNALSMVLMDGKGQLEGHPVDLGLLVAVPPAGDRALLMLGMSVAEQPNPYEGTVADLIRSIAPIAAAAPPARKGPEKPKIKAPSKPAP